MSFATLFGDPQVVQTIFDTIASPMSLKDEVHRCVWVNQAFARGLGRAPADLIGLRGVDFLPEAQAAALAARDDRVLATGEPSESVDLMADAEGRPRPVLTRRLLLEIPDAAGVLRRHVLAVGSVAAPAHVAGPEPRRGETSETARAQILEALAGGEPLDALLAAITRLADEELPGAASAVLLYDADAAGVARTVGAFAPAEVDALVQGSPRRPAPACSAAGEPHLQLAAAADLRPGGASPASQSGDKALGLAACWVHPITDEAGRPLGAFARYSGERRTPGPEEVEAVRRFCQLAGLAIERRRTDERLQAAERQFRLLADHVSDVFWIVDVATGDNLYVSPAYEAVWGRPLAELYRDPSAWLDAVHEADRDRIVSTLGTRETNSENHYRIVRPDGSIRWILDRSFPARNAQGEVAWIVGVAQDITPLKLAEQALRISEERFRIVAAMSSDIVADWDRGADTVWWTDGNEQALFHRARLRLRSWARQIHPNERSRVVGAFRQALTGDGDTWSDEFRVTRRDGSQARLSGAGQLIRDDEGRAVRVILSLTDVTRARELEEQLRQAQRLEAVGRLTGGVAHDFNNLLTAIISGAEALVDGRADQEEHRKVAGVVLEAAERGADLIRNLLAFARKQPLAPCPVDCRGLATSALELIGRTLGDDLEITLETPESDIWCFADPAQLTSALINLCINAREAMPHGGRLKISIASAGLGAQTYAEICVEDTGQGMTAETMARAPEPFFTTRPPGQGSGLGLSMVYGFVTQSGGRMDIESEPCRGTRVRLLLPQTTPEALEPDLDATPPPPLRPPTSRRVLLVEDDGLVRDQTQRQLESLGYQVTAAATGPEALEILCGLEPIDVLLTDVVMPGGLNGRQLADHARLLHPGVGVLFTSGHTEDAILREGRLPPEAAFLPKPYRRSTLAKQLERVLENE